MSAQGSRSGSTSPQRGRTSRTSGGAKSAASKTSSKKLTATPRSTGSRSKSPKSRMSSAKSESVSNSGKASSITSRRVRVRSAAMEENGLRMVDMSGQGMTSLAANLFNRKDVGELDLSGNNLRVLPPDIRRLTTLVHLDLSRNGIRCAHQQDFTGLPKDLGMLPNLEILIVSECNFPFIPPAIWTCQKLKVLDISRNKINYLVPDIGSLGKLQHLNAQQTSIITLPPEIALCQDLEEIMLWGNAIECLPETLKEMPKLKTLAINFRSFCNSVDSYREGLLKKGQIQSEHIPPVLFEMPALDVLDLNETKLNTLPEECAGKLQEFFIAQNFFQKMPAMIHSMLTLKVLDLSDNMIKSIPDNIGHLVNLTHFKMENNLVTNIPTSFGKLNKLSFFNMGGNEIYNIPNEFGNLTSLKTLVLDRNSIRSIPDTLINLEELETLDLTDNKVHTLPMNFHHMKSLKSAHTYQKFHKYGLWLHKNPLTTPPQEVWKTEKPEAIFEYLKRLQIQQTKNLQRQKIYIMGDYQSGKTSLVQAMTTGKASASQGAPDTPSTQMIDFFPWKTDNGVNFIIHDLGGADVYKNTHHLFLDPKGIYLVVHDLSQYDPNNYQSSIGCWLDMLRLHVPGAVVKVVGTKADLCDEDQREFIPGDAELQIKEQQINRFKKLDGLAGSLNTELKESDNGVSSRSDIETEHIKQQKFRVIALKRQPLKIQFPMNIVSSAEGIPGILSLVNELELLAVDQILFPHAQRLIPDHWLKFRLTLKIQKAHCLCMDSVKTLAKEKDFPKNEVLDCLTFLADCGELLWFRKLPAMQNIIFHRPRHIVDIIKGCFRYDIETFMDYETNRIFTCKGQMSHDFFDQSKAMFEQTGQISRPLLKCFWFYMMLSYDDFNYLLDLVPQLDLCYAIPQPEVPKPPSVFTPLMVIPSFNLEDSPTRDELMEYWPYPCPPGQCELTISTTFQLAYPAGLFEKLACRIQGDLTSRMDWKNLIFAEVDSGAILIERREERLAKNSYCVIDLKTRGTDLQNTKAVLEVTGKELQNILSSYAGLTWQCRLKGDNCQDTDLKQCFPSNILAV